MLSTQTAGLQGINSLSILRLKRLGGLSQLCSRSYHCKVARMQQSFIQRRRHLYDQMKVHLEGEVEPVSYTKQMLGWEKASRPPQAVREYLAKRRIGAPITQEDRQFMWFQNGKRNFAPMFLDQMKPWMKLHKNVARREQIPPPVLPEVAVVGRSNCGKSTLVNTLAGRQNSKTSKIPGSTESLLFWKMGKPPVIMLVDLPGYGFAYQGEEKRTEWTELSLFYLSHRSNLKRVLVLVDARRGLMQSDREMISFLERYGVKWQVIVTKCDLLKPRFLAKRLVIMQQILDTEFKGSIGPMIPLSALAKQGVDELRIVLNSFKLDRRTVVNGIEERLLDMREAKRVKRVEKR
ncbi:(ABC) transporter, partial [Perkinsus olseni]